MSVLGKRSNPFETDNKVKQPKAKTIDRLESLEAKTKASPKKKANGGPFTLVTVSGPPEATLTIESCGTLRCSKNMVSSQSGSQSAEEWSEWTSEAYPFTTTSSPDKEEGDSFLLTVSEFHLREEREKREREQVGEKEREGELLEAEIALEEVIKREVREREEEVPLILSALSYAKTEKKPFFLSTPPSPPLLIDLTADEIIDLTGEE